MKRTRGKKGRITGRVLDQTAFPTAVWTEYI